MCSWLWLVKGFHIAMYLAVSSNIQVSDATSDSYIEKRFFEFHQMRHLCVWRMGGCRRFLWHHLTSGLLSCPDILLQFLKHLTSQSSLAWTFVGYIACRLLGNCGNKHDLQDNTHPHIQRTYLQTLPRIIILINSRFNLHSKCAARFGGIGKKSSLSLQYSSVLHPRRTAHRESWACHDEPVLVL